MYGFSSVMSCYPVHFPVSSPLIEYTFQISTSRPVSLQSHRNISMPQLFKNELVTYEPPSEPTLDPCELSYFLISVLGLASFISVRNPGISSH